MPAAYPILLDVTDRLIVIIGAGEVAARKARGLLEAGAKRVRCVAPTFHPRMPDSVQRIAERYSPAHLEDAGLVFAATDQAEVNEAVVRDAHARHLLVNRADTDDEEPGDFSIPARLRRGDILITISAGSPALSALIRDRMDALVDHRWEQLAAAMQELRPLIKSSGIPIEARREIFRELAAEDALDVVAISGIPGLTQWIAARHPELKHA